MANVKCPKCGNLITGVSAGQTVKCPKCGYGMNLSASTNKAPASGSSSTSKNKSAKGAPLEKWKLVSGILSMILSVLCFLQSRAVSSFGDLFSGIGVSGGAGIIVAALMLIGGIVSVITKGNDGNGGNATLIIAFGIAALTGFVLAGVYIDLNIWAAWCFINAVMAVIAFAKNK